MLLFTSSSVAILTVLDYKVHGEGTCRFLTDTIVKKKSLLTNMQILQVTLYSQPKLLLLCFCLFFKAQQLVNNINISYSATCQTAAHTAQRADWFGCSPHSTSRSPGCPWVGQRTNLLSWGADWVKVNGSTHFCHLISD